jgi:hypothetical protein
MPCARCWKKNWAPKVNTAAFVLRTGSAGNNGCGDYLKQIFPTSKNSCREALQCLPCMKWLWGAHRIEGIGDKHVP